MRVAMKQRPDDRGDMYVVRDMRADDRGASTAALLDDLAHLTMRALQVPVALIVVDGGVNGWTTRKIGTAVDTASGVAASIEASDLAALANPIFAEAHGFAFYVATPLRDAFGIRFGTLAVLSEQTRTVCEEDLTTLRKMAGIVERLV